MFLSDYHTHSSFSSDGQSGMADMLAAAEKAGLNELCVTDHCDMTIGACGEFPAAERYKAFVSARAQNTTGVKPLLGLELGEAIFNLEDAKTSVSACPYDFIIGSHHALRGERDFYYQRFKSEEHCRALLGHYFRELYELAEWGGFDVLGHIEYPLRYARRDGIDFELLPRYEEELRELFGILAPGGLGVELNLKALSKSSAGILKLFRECGGEIVTVGSDAHRAESVGKDIASGLDICRAAGFSYVAAFEGRKARFEKI